MITFTVQIYEASDGDLTAVATSRRVGEVTAREMKIAKRLMALFDANVEAGKTTSWTKDIPTGARR